MLVCTMLTSPSLPPSRPAAYAEPIMLSAVDFLGADGDKWIGWGAMPDSVKKLYNRNGRKGLL